MEKIYSKEFIDLVNKAFSKSNTLTSLEKENGNPYYVGFGNPNTDILILGKEKGFDKNNYEQFKFESLENPNEWKLYIENNTERNLDKFYKESHYYINAFTPYLHQVNNGHTWNKYKMLLQYIYPQITNENNNFFKHAFISEINYKPSKYSIIKNFDDQIRISFLNNDFFKSFKVIVLSCGNYLSPTLIKEIFDVKFDYDLSQPRKKIVVYKSNNRVLINTRQLSFDITNEYLESISNIIKPYLLK